MENKGMPVGHKPGTTDASGLRSANEMTDTCPEKGWGGVGSLPGVDAAAGEPINTASGSQVDFGGKSASGQPLSTSMGSPDGEIPLSILMDVGESVGPTEGAGLRSAVGSDVKA